VQFAFLAFLVGQSLQGFGQWKDVLHLVLGCEKAPLTTRPSLYARLLRILQACSSLNP
jgi:A1 cistron-splicing factor AAR2